MCAVCGKPSAFTPCTRCRKREADEKFEERRGKGICPVCNKRPKMRGSHYCHDCTALHDANKTRAVRTSWRGAFRILVWRGYGVYTSCSYEDYYADLDTTAGCLMPLPPSAVDKLPKNGGKGGEQVVNLDGYVKGATRAQIGQWKAWIMHVNGLKTEPSKVK